jgi:hypothetical protein
MQRMAARRYGVAIGAVALTLASLIAVRASATPAASGQPKVRIGSDSTTDPHGSYFVVSAVPGAEVTEHVLVSNPTTTPMTVMARGADSSTEARTGAVYSGVSDPLRGVGTWITVPTGSFVLNPNEERDIAFTVSIPRDTTVGQHLGGLAVFSPVAPPAPSGGQLQVSVTLQPERLIAVEVDVPGPAAPKLVVSTVAPIVSGDGIALAIGVSNEGTAFARGSGRLTVDSTALVSDFPIDTFVPGTAIKLPVPWSRDVPTGSHAVSVELSYGSGLTATWTGTVDIVGSTRADLEHSLAALRAAGATAKRHSRNWFPYVTWGTAALVVIAVAVRTRRPPPYRFAART